MFAAIRRVNDEGTAVLLVEQNVSMALRVAHRAYVLEEGRMVAEGTPDDADAARRDPPRLPGRLRSGP